MIATLGRRRPAQCMREPARYSHPRLVAAPIAAVESSQGRRAPESFLVKQPERLEGRCVPLWHNVNMYDSKRGTHRRRAASRASVTEGERELRFVTYAAETRRHLNDLATD